MIMIVNLLDQLIFMLKKNENQYDERERAPQLGTEFCRFGLPPLMEKKAIRVLQLVVAYFNRRPKADSHVVRDKGRSGSPSFTFTVLLCSG